MILFQLIVFLFAISVHESAHAWTANRCGDPTARMLGRITLNPIKHIDPIGTILFPALAIIAQLQFHRALPVLGWAKPTPVNPRNFKNPVLDDVLTSVAGPISNFLVATISVVLLVGVSLSSPTAREMVRNLPRGLVMAGLNSPLVPVTLFLYLALQTNVALAIFNLIPVPPLDGSHVLRHFLPSPALMLYDRLGVFGLLVLVYFGGSLLNRLIDPFLAFFDFILLRF